MASFEKKLGEFLDSAVEHKVIEKPTSDNLTAFADSGEYEHKGWFSLSTAMGGLGAIRDTRQSDISSSNKYPPDQIKNNTDIWVTLHKVDGFYEPKTASFYKPTNLAGGEVVLKGHSKGWNGIEYGIEKYFVPEGTKEPNRGDTTVELNVYKNGKVRINHVFVKGKVWP